ncbi:leucine rich repeat protein-like protein [Mytilinidion resinicola]|uniref:Leucine rich repeat protein-like protein n=1 Tax=Mytilinidion resinicola TaxID=574789 RepID=A0A6A6YT79_9PEZI|nr:leucine rich repeat protein-like protein [Mytilinidion resinicola]KAF2811573.1 leucine rich repeat protein-like protein [Mytilinidion resinicola]
MSHPGKEGKDGRKRRSIFARTPLSSFTPIHDKAERDKDEPANLLRKRRTNSLLTNLQTSIHIGEDDPFGDGATSPGSPVRPPYGGSRGSSRTSRFGSLRSLRSLDDYEEARTPTSIKTPSVNMSPLDDTFRNRHVLHHGEVQTSSSMFRKKKEYLVLTETHLVRFKSHHKASETFSAVPSPLSRGLSNVNVRHSQSPSAGSHEFKSVPSEASGDREMGTPLRQIVAVYDLDDGRPHFAIEITYLDDETNHASSMTLQFGDPEDMKLWLAAIREAANRVRLADLNPLSDMNSELCARVVEREFDYVPPNYAIYKVVQRPLGKTGSRSSSDDLSKAISTVCFLAIGVHKVHLIPLFRPQRPSGTSLASQNAQSSYGILTITELKVSEKDDSFELTFRKPLERPKVLYLASLASHDIAVRLRYVEENMRPEWESRPYTFDVPDDVKRDILRNSSPHPIDSESLDRTLIGYCIAYDANPENIRYQITYPDEDSPRFELLPPDNRRNNQYTALELLSVMRALRYNESFCGLTFKDVHLDVLNGLEDRYGTEHVCIKTKRGTLVRMDVEELERSCLLVQEIRAMAVTSRKLRRMDFSSCISRKPRNYEDTGNKDRDIGCGIVEALFPLCKYQTTNVDWIALNNIELGETDFDYLVAAAVERACHFRALELSGCGLTDRTLSLLLDSLRPQENTLEAINISRNPFRLSPAIFDSQIGSFAYITKLNLAHVARTSGSEPLISYETFRVWRLQELVLSGTSLNNAMVDSIASYLLDYKQSKALRELRLDHCYLTGKDVAYLMHSMTEKPGYARELHLDVSENNIEQNLDQLTTAIASGLAPSSLTIRLIEFEEEAEFRQLIIALATNRTIRALDISRASLPCDADDETCHALEMMFAENSTLLFLDISGEDSRLETTKLGVGINKALRGLERNRTLQTLHIQFQKLGLQGASTLADVLKTNDTLQELHCENNGIGLPGFTDLVNALHRNTTLQYLPAMQESRLTALKQTEDQVKQMRDDGGVEAPRRSASSTTANAISSSLSKFTKGTKFMTMPSTSSKAQNGQHHGHAHRRSGSGGRHPPSMLLSDQDINAALRLVDESWGRQMYRLQQYLGRNWNIKMGVSTQLEVDEEEFERPDTATDLGRVVERVRSERTPTAEKELELGEWLVGGEGDDGDREEWGGTGTREGKHLERVVEASSAQVREASAFEKELEMSFAANGLDWDGGKRFG